MAAQRPPSRFIPAHLGISDGPLPLLALVDDPQHGIQVAAATPAAFARVAAEPLVGLPRVHHGQAPVLFRRQPALGTAVALPLEPFQPILDGTHRYSPPPR